MAIWRKVHEFKAGGHSRLKAVGHKVNGSVSTTLGSTTLVALGQLGGGFSTTPGSQTSSDTTPGSSFLVTQPPLPRRELTRELADAAQSDFHPSDQHDLAARQMQTLRTARHSRER